MSKNRSLIDFIQEKIEKNEYMACFPNIGIAVACEDGWYRWGESCDKIALNMYYNHHQNRILYTWIWWNGEISGAKRQVVKYGKKPGSCDGADTVGFVTKYGKKYWLDEFVRYC